MVSKAIFLGGVAAAFAVVLVVLIPNLLGLRVYFAERRAKINLKVLCEAEASYQTACGVYASSWGDLTAGQAGNQPALPDPVWVEGRELSGYVFTGHFNANGFTFKAVPIDRKSFSAFSIDASGQIAETR